MSFTLDEIKQIIRRSLYQLWNKDKYLLNVNASERSITHRLAIYLREEFSDADLDVDCEYNREGDKPKKYQEIIDEINRSGIKADDTVAKTAFPDIIVHKRGINDKNLLVIEIKKLSGNAMPIDSIDEKKLRAFLDSDQLNYKFGLALQIPIRYGNSATLFWFEQGTENPTREECNMENGNN